MNDNKSKPTALAITDTTFRDGHQSLLATRLRIEDMLPIMAETDEIGYHSLEVWGGATFDVATRFLNEDPWERLRLLKKTMPKTPLQMLLRGQNLVGYRNYADDAVRDFVLYAAECGMDIFRVFDALNDERNFESAFRAIQEAGKHIQGAISYSLTERKLGGPVYTIEYYVKKAKALEEMGADSICIKDMAGILSPYDAFELVTALKKVLSIPIQLHTHYTSGMGSMTYLKAIEAGVDVVDTACAPFALRTSQPAVEPILVALAGLPRDPGLDIRKILKIGEHLEAIAPKYRDHLDKTKLSVIDTDVLLHQIPGGMISNLVGQLKEASALDRLPEVYRELPQTRKELGYPPLVTPTSQIIGVQAVLNVLMGRYKMVSSQIKDYCYGLYGAPPLPIDPEVRAQALKGYPRGETPIACRAADVLDPEMEKAREETKDIAKDLGDILVYALYPQTGMRFLRWKYGLEEAPPEVKPRTMADVKREDELIRQVLKGELVPPPPPKETPERSARTKGYNVFVDGDFFSVEVDERGELLIEPEPGRKTAAPAVQQPAKKAVSVAPKPVAPQAKEPVKTSPEAGVALKAPMPGIIVQVLCQVGLAVKAGDELIILEAMKMQNALTAASDGQVAEIRVKSGDSVGAGEILVVIS
ncbi:MAG: pyruvate carboxylase subunit B [Smithellaceae bacterium]|nr:pyruvate carboxylase subunit B [Smithellaceae bacterium]